MAEKKDGDKMAIKALDDIYTIDNETAYKIISTSPIKVKDHGIFNDLDLNKEERISNAEEILKSRR